MIIDVTSPVSIHIAIKGVASRFASLEYKACVSGASEVMEDAVQSTKVIRTRVGRMSS